MSLTTLSPIHNRTRSSIISGCIETLRQGEQFLSSISNKEYQLAAPPYVNSSIGKHFRHLLDLFYAIYIQQDTIDYNMRRRDSVLETSRIIALENITSLISWLETLDEHQLRDEVLVSTEVCMSSTQVAIVSSTLERELSFVALHATHHYAMANVIVSALKINTVENDEFGYAPATVSYLRGQ
ncbi:hypothetical protein DN730_00840 [Marinomonas piezotolerans]|uniref:DinB family protein n=1 Tax=Marinomonas piezotolerans TaxID=2213058 RepID=A0A370UCW2_9GAMM|nr:hypothetical protein [Marinomonas piezotolerans]RDL45630.1 hypothetical protein DN730_00840 [Marinomonas piezotolerans]